MPTTTAKSPMFRSLRFRMTILNASTAVVIIFLLRIMTISWLTEQFTMAADATLYERLSTELVQNTLPLPQRLTAFSRNFDEKQTAYASQLNAVGAFLPSDTPTFMAAMLSNPNTVSTYIININNEGIPIRNTGTIPPFPVQYESLVAALDAPDRFDIRTVVVGDGKSIRVLSYHLPENPTRYIQVGRPMADYLALQDQLRYILLLVGFLGMVVLTIASWFLSGYFVGPTARAYESQKRFITNASHELRTPLSIVRTSAQIALLDAPTNHPTTELLHSIVAENRHMTNMIENLLTIARTEERIPNVASYDVIPLLHESLAAVQRVTPDRAFSLFSQNGPILVQSDPHYVSHIVRILLDNAIAHTTIPVQIAIHLVQTPTSVEIQVRDSGSGVPPEHISSIFEPFVTYSRGTTHRGSGIGLNIALTFARAMNAQLRYEDNKPHGACFVLQLPVK
jgi:signal transduction histidine kinase